MSIRQTALPRQLPWLINSNSSDSKDQALGLGTPLNEPVKHPAYAGTMDVKDPRLSPLYGDMKGLAPMLIQTGEHDLFLTESEDLERKAAAAGVPVTLSVYPGMPHDFSLLLPELNEAVQANREIADFVNRVMK